MPEYIHQPVMVAEVQAALQPHANGRYIDGTIGGGGHAAAILAMSAPTGWLFGCDRDGAAVEAAARRLAPFGARFVVRQGNFADLAGWVEEGSFDGALLDLGVSSAQLASAERGFSFQADGPLDMRMDPSQSLCAVQVIAEASVEELARIFRELGDVREARRLARMIDRERQSRSIQRTRQLAQLVERWQPRHGQRLHPATRVFQALRMVVNDEVGSLQRGLWAVWTRLKVGGRLAVITFHSVEDRVVKEFGRCGARAYTVAGEVDVPELRQPRAPELKWITRKPIRPRPAEVAANPRARSAQLRIFERIDGA